MIEMESQIGDTIDATLKNLKDIALENNDSVFCDFNDKILTSEMSLDEAYKIVTGLTKNESDLKVKEENEKYILEQEQHKEKIPELTKYWIEEGKKYLRKEDLEFWNEIVPIRLKDLYRGMELECLINIVKILNKSNNLLEVFEEAKEELDNQGHSGMSFGLVCSMIVRFHKHGEKFVIMVN